jgi:type VI protein secretion system component VasF
MDYILFCIGILAILLAFIVLKKNLKFQSNATFHNLEDEKKNYWI